MSQTNKFLTLSPCAPRTNNNPLKYRTKHADTYPAGCGITHIFTSNKANTTLTQFTFDNTHPPNDLYIDVYTQLKPNLKVTHKSILHIIVVGPAITSVWRRTHTNIPGTRVCRLEFMTPIPTQTQTEYILYIFIYWWKTRKCLTQTNGAGKCECYRAFNVCASRMIGELVLAIRVCCFLRLNDAIFVGNLPKLTNKH